jgi:hypothetical protein
MAAQGQYRKRKKCPQIQDKAGVRENFWAKAKRRQKRTSGRQELLSTGVTSQQVGVRFRNLRHR